LFLVSAQFPGNSLITNVGANIWQDTSGEMIQAHGGQIFAYNNVFYWVGESYKEPPNFLSEGINCYSSNDLIHWTFVNEIFHNTSIIINVEGPYRIERPKILYNQENNNFVMWFHLDTASFSLQRVAVATCLQVCGNYQFESSFQPDNLPSYDMGLYQDDDEVTSYLVRSVNNQYAGISYLDSSYLNTTGIISKGPQIEGVAIFKLINYYLIGSHLTGWSPNPAVLCYTDNTNNLNDAIWFNCNNPTNSDTTYNAQSTFVLRLYDNQSNGYVFMLMLDIWNYPNVQNATYLWLPILFNSTTNLYVPYFEKWVVEDFLVYK